MKKLMLTLVVVFSLVFTFGNVFASQQEAKPEAVAQPAVEQKAEAVATEEVLVGKLVVENEKVTIVVEGKEPVVVKANEKVEEIKKIEKFSEKTFEFKGTFVTEKVKEGEKEVEVKMFVISSFAEKAAEAPKAEKKKEEKK